MKPHNHSQSSSSFSRLRLNSRNDVNASQNSSKKHETISKYFTSTKCDDSNNTVNLGISKEEIVDDQCSTSDESPYKSSLTEIKHSKINISANEEVDFKTPKHISRKNVHRKCENSSKNKSRKLVKKSVKSNQMILTKSVKQNSNNDDVNQEHLELALALSRSLIENRKTDNEENDNGIDYPSTQQKLANVKQSLLQFTYQSNTTKMEVSQNRTPMQMKKKTKKSKYQYVTPILYLRTQEDRENLIAEKVALILSESEQKGVCDFGSHLHVSKEPESKMLQNQWNSENKIFKMSNFLEDFKHNDNFYVKTLQIPQSTTKCGNLLRDWNEIPGREKSPLGNANNLDIDNNKHKEYPFNSIFEDTKKVTSELCNFNSSPSPKKLENNFQIRNCCVSPDLFESDDDELKIKQSPVNKVSPIIKRSLETPPSMIQLNVSDDSESQSLLKSITPSKKSLNRKTNSFRISESEDKHRSSSSMSDEIFTNDKGICSFESFCKESDNYFDLTYSSDEERHDTERNKINAGLNPSDETKIIVNDSLKSDASVTTAQSSSRTGVSDIFTKSLCLDEDNSKLGTTRQSKSLNVTDYIYDMLNDDRESFDLNQDNFDKEESVDLTQNSSGSSYTQSPSKLLDVNNKKECDDAKQENKNCSKDDLIHFQRYDSFKSTTSDDLTSSQYSQESIHISDEELNYSSTFQKPCVNDQSKNKYEFFNSESENEEHVKDATPKMNKQNSSNEFSPNCRFLQEFENEKSYTSIVKSKRLLFNDLQKDSCNMLLENENILVNSKDSEVGPSNDTKVNESNNTPKNEMIIKTANVTPMVNYDGMNTPKINKELHKFGLKPLKRQRGIQILKHIYETTHPLVGNKTREQSESDEDNSRVAKKRKSDTKLPVTPTKHKNKKNLVSDSKIRASNVLGIKERIEIVGDLMAGNETVEDLIFERKQSKKILSCRVPLHIAWHNLLAAQPELRENILLYEPLQLEVLYKNLKEQGYKYHIEDLLTFLDKKCITIRTNQNQGHNKHNKKRKSTSPRKSK